MTRPKIHSVRILVPTVAAVVALAACGGNGNDTAGKKNDAGAVRTPTTDATIAAELPDAIKQAGVIKAAIDPSFPVNNYYDTDGKTVIGLSPELLQAAGQLLGVKIQVSTVKLATIIPGLQAGRYDMAGMVLTDSAEREKQIDLINFQQAGQELLVPTGNPANITTLDDTCGHKIAVAEGGTPVTVLQKQSTQCTGSGKPAVTIQQFPDVNQAFLAVQNNRADATITDFTKSEYEVQHSGGKLERIGSPFAATKAGWAVPKDSPLGNVLADAINALIKDGTYGKIFAKYQLDQAQLPQVVINSAGQASSS